MQLTINVEDDANVKLDDVDIDLYGDTIVFSVEGEITDISSDILTEFAGEELSPVEIMFETE